MKERTKPLALVFGVSVSYSGSREAGAIHCKGIILAVHTVMFLGFEKLRIFLNLARKGTGSQRRAAGPGASHWSKS